MKPPAALIRLKSSLESSVGRGEEYEVVEGESKAIKKMEIFRVLMLRAEGIVGRVAPSPAFKGQELPQGKERGRRGQS